MTVLPVSLFRQTGDFYRWVTPLIDRSGTAELADSLFTISVPTGIQVSPLIAINVNVVGAHVGTDIREVAIVSQVADQGTRRLEFVMRPTGYMCDFRIRDVQIGQFGQHGIRFDNTISKTDGFFSGSIKERMISKGSVETRSVTASRSKATRSTAG